MVDVVLFGRETLALTPPKFDINGNKCFLPWNRISVLSWSSAARLLPLMVVRLVVARLLRAASACTVVAVSSSIRVA